MNKFVIKGTLKFAPRLAQSGKQVSMVVETPPAEGQQYPDSVEVVGFDHIIEQARNLAQGQEVEIMGRIRQRKSTRTTEQGKAIYEMQAVASALRASAPTAPEYGF